MKIQELIFLEEIIKCNGDCMNIPETIINNLCKLNKMSFDICNHCPIVQERQAITAEIVSSELTKEDTYDLINKKLYDYVHNKLFNFKVNKLKIKETDKN